MRLPVCMYIQMHLKYVSECLLVCSCACMCDIFDPRARPSFPNV